MSTAATQRIYLSPPCVGEEERQAAMAAFDSGYVAPCGPMVDEFEKAVAKIAGRKYAVAVSSGTAAIDLLMEEFGVDCGWTVFAPTMTFVATVGPAWHRGAKLVFVDSIANGTIDPELLDVAMKKCGDATKKLVIGVDLYGECCDYDTLAEIAGKNGGVYICDSAESLGATYKGRPAGSSGAAALFSFNGNKIATTSGGGAIVTDDEGIASRAKNRSQQSRAKSISYLHNEVGYNYRMSNILASIGLAQLKKLPDFLQRRASIKAKYKDLLGDKAEFLPEVFRGSNNWLTVMLTSDSKVRDSVLASCDRSNIEARPAWRPMHMQNVFVRNMAEGRVVFSGGKVAEDIFARGVCLPSGSGLSDDDLRRVACVVGDVL